MSTTTQHTTNLPLARLIKIKSFRLYSQKHFPNANIPFNHIFINTFFPSKIRYLINKTSIVHKFHFHKFISYNNDMTTLNHSDVSLNHNKNHDYPLWQETDISKAINSCTNQT